MYYLFLPRTTESNNNPYVQSKKFYLNWNMMYPMIQKNNNWEYNPCVPSTTFHKILFFRKGKKPIKYNVVRTIIFCSTLQKIFIFLDLFEQIKFCRSAFQKLCLYLEELYRLVIPQKFINCELGKFWRRPE